MHITELKNDSEYHVRVKIPAIELSSKIEKEITKIAKTAKMDGFRVGKVPTAIIKKKYAPSLRYEAIRDIVSNSINKITRDKNLNIASEPQIDDLVDKENQDLEFSLKFELVPMINLPDLEKITVEKPVLSVTDEELDKEIQSIADEHKDYDKTTKGKAKKGDQVTIDAVGYVNDKAFDGGKLTDHKLVLGSGAFIPGFEDQLIGAKAGDDVSVKVTFPEKYHAANLAGQPAEFKVQVKAVHQPQKIEVNDKFADRFGCKDLAELKEKMRTTMEKEAAPHIHVYMKMKLFDQLEKLLDFEVPKSLLNKELDSLHEQSKNGGSEDTEEMSEAEQQKYFNDLATRRVRIGLMLAEYIKRRNIKIAEADVRDAIIAQAQAYPGQQQQIIEFYQKNPQAWESLKGPILEEKGVQHIFDNEIKFKEKKYNKDKLKQLLDA